MKDPTVADLVAKASFFAGLEKSDREALAARMRPQEYGAGQLIFSRGDEPRDLYVVAAGRVRLSILSSDGRELSVAHATAIEPTRVHTLSRTVFKQAMDGNPRIAQAVINFLCARLRDTDQSFVSVALHSVEVRLARFLLTQIQQASPDAEGKAVPLAMEMSQSELALLIGASRPKVNVALTQLEELGAVRRDGKRLLGDTYVLEDVAALD